MKTVGVPEKASEHHESAKGSDTTWHRKLYSQSV